MNVGDNISEKVSSYLRGELSEKEQLEFESALVHDSELSKELAFQRSLEEVIAVERGTELKQEFAALEQSLTQPNLDVVSSTNSSRLVVKALSAIIILALVVASYLYFTGAMAGDNRQQLFADNFSPYPNTLIAIERGEASDDQSVRKSIMQAYDAGKYSEVIAQSDNPTLAEDSPIRFYKAIALMQETNFQQAANILDDLNTKSLKDYQSAIWWYGALAHLQLDNTSKTIDYLEELVSSSDRYQRTKAKKLLDQLR